MKTVQAHIKAKVVIIGDEAVGKTSIARRYIGDIFLTGYKATIGADFYVKRSSYNIESIGQCTFEWVIFDMSGQQQFEVIRPIYYSNAKAALVVFDLSRSETFRSIPRWIQEFWRYTGGINPLIIIGNKVDLRKTMNCIPYEYGVDYANKLSRIIGAPVVYIETSAKDGTNIEKAFELLADTIIKFSLRKAAQMKAN